MEKLLKQKESIERDIKDLKERHEELQTQNKNNREKLDVLRAQENAVILRIKQLREKLKQKKTTFSILKQKVREYKSEKNAGIREIYIAKYDAIVKSVNEVNFVYSLQVFDSFDACNKIAQGICGFNNLRNQLDVYIQSRKTALKTEITKNIVETNEIHKVIYALKILIRYEEYFVEGMINSAVADYIVKRFEYHFMTNKETNRLDKSKWIFDYLLDKTNDVHKILRTYVDLNKTNTQSVTVYMKDLMKVVCLLINKKIASLHAIDSNQKKEVFIDFNYHLNVFVNEVRKVYNIDLKNNFKEFITSLSKQKEDEMIEKVQDAHKNDYTEWIKLYENIIRECIDLNKKYITVRIDTVVDTILEYNLIFIDNMRYIDRKEIHVLIWLFNHFEKFKEIFITEINDLSAEAMETSDAFINIDDNIVYKIGKFNAENYKLIKLLFDNDISNILSIKYYFINDIARILDEYKECKMFCKLKEMAASIVDEYLLRNVLLKYRLDKDEFLDLLEIFGNLKGIFYIKKWRSRECMKCVKGIFENKPVTNEFSDTVYDLYA